MASLMKGCRHPRSEWDTCRCQWRIRYQQDGKTFYVKAGRDRASAQRTFAHWKNDPPPPLREIARAPGLELPKQQKRPWVYFIAGANLVKVGTTADLRKRIGAIQADSPVPLTLMLVVEGGRDVERDLHTRFDAFRRHGEWFALPIGWENDPGLLEMTKPRHLEVAA
jgi:hypothetical protein